MSKKRITDDWTSAFDIERVSVGYDKVFGDIDAIAKEQKAFRWYPPYNIRKVSDTEYGIDVDVSGYDKDDLVAKIDAGVMTLSAPARTALTNAEVDDNVYFHQGIFPGGDLSVKFWLAPGVTVKSANYDDGIVSFSLVYSSPASPVIMVPIGPIADAVEAKPYVPVYNSAGELVKPSEDVPAVVEAPAIVEVPAENIPVMVNAEDTSVPTVEVSLPPVLPQVIEVVPVESVAETPVDTFSPEPQVTLVVQDATVEVKADEVVTDVIKTEDGKADIVIAIPADIHEELISAGIDPVEVVAEAIEKAELPVVDAPVVDVSPATATTVTPAEGDAVTVVVPEVLPQVVEVTVDANNAVVLAPISDTIAPESELHPVVTAEGSPDIVVAVSPETAEKLDDLGINVTTDISEAVKEINPEIVLAPAPEVVEAPAREPVIETPAEPVAELPPEAPREVVSVVVNAEVETVPTVEVQALDPMPAVVEVTSVEVVPSVDVASPEPQATIILSDATNEIKSDDVVTEIIKTEEGKADIVVAVPAEIHEELTSAGIDPVEAVKAAIEASEVAAPETPAPATEEKILVNVTPADADTVTVSMPAEIPSVVEVTVTADNVVELKDVVADVPADATLVPVVTAEGSPDIVVAVSPETETKLDELGVDVAKDIGEAVVKAEPEIVTAPVVEAPVEPAPEAAPVEPVSVIINGETDEKPTTEVILPDPLPQIVEIKEVKVELAVDNTSEHPQVTVIVGEAVHEVSDNVSTEVVNTPDETTSDIVVAIPDAAKEALDAIGLNPVETVAAAIEKADVDLPPAPSVDPTPVVETQVASDVVPESEAPVVVAAPEVIPQVVEATVEVVPTAFDSAGSPTETKTVISLNDVSADIPASAEVVPVVTADEQHDIMVAVTPETAAVAESAGVDIAAAVSDALVTANTEVVTVAVDPVPEVPAEGQ